MTQFNIGQRFLQTARQNPDLLAIVTDTTMVSYDDLEKLVRSFAACLAQRGVKPGSVVAIDSEDILLVAATLLATAVLGASWVAQRHTPVLSDILTPTHFFRGSDATTADDKGTEVIDASWGAAQPIATFDPTLPDAPFLYVNTSGTTGSPKVLYLTQRLMCLRADAVADDFVARQTVFCALFSPIAFPYISRFLPALTRGATVVHSREIGLWFAAGVNHLYGSVTQVAQMLGQISLPRKLPMIHVSGSRLSDGLARHLLENFEIVVDLYASTETNRSFKNIKYLDDNGLVQTRGERLDSIVQIVDEQGQPLPDGDIGLIRVQNGYLAPGYLNAPQAVSFRDGWFYSGDFGHFTAQGALQVVGRTGDVLNIGGVKINALAIDDILRGIDGIADAMCFDVPSQDGPNRLMAFIVPAPGVQMQDLAARVSALGAAKLPGVQIPKRLIEIDKVPRAHDGGARRFECRTIYESRSDDA